MGLVEKKLKHKVKADIIDLSRIYFDTDMCIKFEEEDVNVLKIIIDFMDMEKVNQGVEIIYEKDNKKLLLGIKGNAKIEYSKHDRMYRFIEVILNRKESWE